jgi:hypothetical protein
MGGTQFKDNAETSMESSPPQATGNALAVAVEKDAFADLF